MICSGHDPTIDNKAVFNARGTAMAIVEENNIISEVNSEFERLTGYSRQHIEKGMVWSELVHGDDQSRLEFYDRLRIQGSTDPPRTYMLRLRRPDGQIRTVAMRVGLIPDTKKSLISLMDITELKQEPNNNIAGGTNITVRSGKIDADLRLDKGEEKYRTLFDNSVLGIYRTSHDGEILEANPALVQMLGYDSFEELSHRNLEIEGFSTEYSRKKFMEILEQSSEIRGLESAWLKKDGTPIHVRENSKAIRDEAGHVQYIDGTVEDITEIKKAKEQIRLGKAYLEGLFESAPEGILLIGMDGRVVNVNSAFLDMFGYGRDEVIGSRVDELISSGKYADESMNLTREVFARRIVSIETVRRRKNGEEFDVSLLASPIIHDGTLVAAYGIYRDISARKMNETRIEQLNDMLRDITKILRHDLVNNLMMIQQAAELISVDGKLDRLSIIDSSALRGMNIIEKMREFEASLVLEEAPKTYSLHALIDEIMADFELEYDITVGSDINVDTGFYTVVQNLVMNAIRHGHTDRMHFSLFDAGSDFVLEVSDFGTGIPDNVKGYIFEQGFSYGNNRGSGLGLYIIHSMISRYGGRIQVMDNTPKGTIFRILLPGTNQE